MLPNAVDAYELENNVHLETVFYSMSKSFHKIAVGITMATANVILRSVYRHPE